MAGTLVIDTITDGSGNSGSATSAIRGSAKAWVSFNGTSGAIRRGFNVSSVTRSSAGTFTVNFTSAMPTRDYCSVATATTTSYPDWSNVRCPNSSNAEKLTGSVTVGTGNRINGTYADCDDISVSIFY